MEAADAIRTLGVMLAAGLVAQPLADLLRLPRMLVMLGAGAILGPSVAGVLDVPLDSDGVQVLLMLGVSFILFHGGLQLSARVLRQVAVGLGLLVVPGVILTAAVCGVVAWQVFDVPLSMGLLIGAVLAPTDPAMLIPLFERLRIRPKVAQTVVAESALNDPTGAVLALSLLGVVAAGQSLGGDPVVDFVAELGISTGIGIGFGLVLALVISSHRAGIWAESAGIAVLAIVALAVFSADSAGGSGYLGAFVAGLLVGNMQHLRLAMHVEHQVNLRVVSANLAHVMVMLVFVTLGAELPFDAIADEWLPALAVLAALLFVARPLCVLACLLPDRRGAWEPRELVFMGWVRETGVVPAALAAIVVAEGVERGEVVVVTVALAIVVTLALQTSTKPWLARRLDLLDAPTRLPPVRRPAGAPSRIRRS